jgi:DNA replication protein DnaC
MTDNPQRPDGPAARPITREELKEREALRELERIRTQRTSRPPSGQPKQSGLNSYLNELKTRISKKEKTPSSAPPERAVRCQACQDKSFVTRSVPVGDPDFGKRYPCPACGGGIDYIGRAKRKLERRFGDVWMYGSNKLYQFGMVDFLEMDDHLKVGKMQAIDAAYEWSQRNGSPFLVLSGEPGLGKTCLASAAYIDRVADRCAGLPVEYNALMNCCLAMIDDDDQTTQVALQEAYRVPVLFLDDLGNTFITRETPGRLRWLFEIVNYRYNNELPTIVTTNLSMERLYQQFDTKLADRLVEFAHWIDVKPPSLRFRYE